MKRILLSALILGSLLSQTAIVQAQQSSLRLTPSQIQRINSGLYRFESQDFFRRGQQQLEGEIKTLNQRRLFLTNGVLKIDPETLKQPDFSQFERPRGLPSNQEK